MNDDQLKQTQNSQFISFHDFSPINRSGGGGQAQLHIGSPEHQQFGHHTNEPTGLGIIEDLQDFPQQNHANSSKSFWTIEYYQQFFNVNTNDVTMRIMKSVIPHGSDNYLLSHIRPNPDLYGPFWICITLIFAIAISGNIANYLQTANTGTYHWKYEFHIVSYAATIICLYVWLLPLGLWAALKWTSHTDNTSMDAELIEANDGPGLMELLCLYGYSLSIYIPVAFLWTIQISWLQWTLVGVATVLSGGVLLRSLSPLIYGKQKPIYIAIIIGMHLLLAVGFMEYFFHVPSRTVTDDVNNIVKNATLVNLPKVIPELSLNTNVTGIQN